MSKTTFKYCCLQCRSDWMDHAATRAHLTEHHKLDLKTTKGTQQATAFLDGEGYSEQHYDLTFGDVKLTKHVLIEHNARPE